MKKYSVCDLEKSLLDADTMIEAKSPLEAARKYIKQLEENKKVSRDIFNHGRLVVRGYRGLYVYNVE